MSETVHTPGLTSVELLSQAEYFYTLQQSIATAEAGTAISMVVMGMEPREPETARLIDELGKAAKRGALVTFGVDAYTFMVTDGETYVPGPLFLPLPFGQRIFKERYRAFDRLTDKPNVKAGVLNMPKRLLSNPFAGRSHIKLAAIDNSVYVGGPNLYALNGREDMVLRLDSQQLSPLVHTLIRKFVATGNIVAALSSQDSRIPIDAQTELLLDAGVPGSSLIMDTALQAIGRAEQWVVLGSQFFPTRQVTTELHRALKRKVDIHVVRNRPQGEKSLKQFWQLGSLAINRLQLPDQFFADQVAADAPRSHTALLVTDNEVIKGSHNFHGGGVAWGTAEAALHRWGDATLSRAMAWQLFQQAGLAQRFPLSLS